MAKKIFGITYFSVLQGVSGKYVVSSEEGFAEKLFNPSRLEFRLKIFSEIVAPQLAELDKRRVEYKHIVLFSSQMPDIYKSELRDMLGKYDFMVPHEVYRYEEFSLRVLLKSFLSDNDGVFGVFGLDDDDLVATDFFNKVESYISRPFVGFNIVFSRGVSGIFSKGEGFYNIRDVRFPFINIGQTLICENKPDGMFLPSKGSHMQTDIKLPTVVDSRSFNFLWLRHEEQDTFSKSDNHKALSKIKMDLDSYQRVNDFPKDKFPAMVKFLKADVRESKTIAGEIKLLKRKEAVFIYHDSKGVNVCGDIGFEYNIINLGGGERRQALMVFSFSRVLTDVETVKSGLVKSSVGYYRYFMTGSRDNVGSITISVPESVSLKSVSVMKWGDDDIFVKSIVVKASPEFCF